MSVRSPRGRRRVLRLALCAGLSIALPLGRARAANQTDTLSPVVIGGALPIATQIEAPLSFGSATLPTLHSFARATYLDPYTGHSQWLVMGGLTNGLHDLASGFDPTAHNTSVYVIDPVTRQVWGRSLADPGASGLTAAQLDSLSASNAQSTQIGSHLYIAGGYGPHTLPNGDLDYETFDTLTSVDLPGMIDWVKTGTGTAASRLRQISDPTFQVTGGEMLTSPSTGLTHLVFGQNYPSSYEARQNGEYTNQVRSFAIVDDASGLRVTNVVAHDPQADFRRRDLNVVPTVHTQGGAAIDGMKALAGVFTPSFGVWTVPVSIDANGNATEPDPTSAGTFKQGMNGYRSANIGLYSRSAGQMHTLLLGGISYQFYDASTGTIGSDFNIPFTSDGTDLVTDDATGATTQFLLSGTYPSILSPETGQPLLLGAETEFFLADGVPTFDNGVIDLDALHGRTLVGWLFGGIAAEQPNNGPTFGSNAVFPVYITPVPEPLSLATVVLGVGLALRGARRRARSA